MPPRSRTKAGISRAVHAGTSVLRRASMRRGCVTSSARPFLSFASAAGSEPAEATLPTLSSTASAATMPKTSARRVTAGPAPAPPPMCLTAPLCPPRARHQQVVCLIERQPGCPGRFEGELQGTCQGWVLDDHDGEVGAALDGILHPEHDDRLVDDDQLQWQLRHEACLLAGLDERLHTADELGVVEGRELVHRARRVLTRHGQAL